MVLRWEFFSPAHEIRLDDLPEQAIIIREATLAQLRLAGEKNVFLTICFPQFGILGKHIAGIIYVKMAIQRKLLAARLQIFL